MQWSQRAKTSECCCLDGFAGSSTFSLESKGQLTSLAEVQQEITAFPPLLPTSRRVRQSYVRNRENSLEVQHVFLSYLLYTYTLA